MSQFNQLSQKIGIAIHNATREEMKKILKIGKKPSVDMIMAGAFAYVLSTDLEKPVENHVKHSINNIDPMELELELAREV